MVEIQRKKIVNCQLIKLNCQLDNIGNTLWNIIIDNISKVWALPCTVNYMYFVSTRLRTVINLMTIYLARTNGSCARCFTNLTASSICFGVARMNWNKIMFVLFVIMKNNFAVAMIFVTCLYKRLVMPFLKELFYLWHSFSCSLPIWTQPNKKQSTVSKAFLR